jgi:PHP family Zn ribbon phosphoesterase
MKTIIKHGYNNYTTHCDNCLCFFEYEIKDVENDYVSCPDCGDKCRHNSAHYVVGSQIKEIENNEKRI